MLLGKADRLSKDCRPASISFRSNLVYKKLPLGELGHFAQSTFVVVLDAALPNSSCKAVDCSTRSFHILLERLTDSALTIFLEGDTALRVQIPASTRRSGREVKTKRTQDGKLVDLDKLGQQFD